jgi:hypothetical protein
VTTLSFDMVETGKKWWLTVGGLMRAPQWVWFAGGDLTLTGYPKRWAASGNSKAPLTTHHSPLRKDTMNSDFTRRIEQIADRLTTLRDSL